MASLIPFNKIVSASLTVEPHDFIAGSGTLSVKGIDRTVSTADGVIHHIRQALVREARCEVFGDVSQMNSAPGLASTVSPYYNSTLVATFNALISTSYDNSSKTSSVRITGTP
ncbi:hypothetical protein SDC9_208892 [bioreactor metagenome]|uniref:Uncharacterized protein n=1 Tax=bioreactor metagenome TaxID=1076179 RepID=A0A645JBU3_9ZZZZ